jgi:magnesium chelatase family protein
MDRIDIHLEVPSVPYKDLSGVTGSESSEKILGRVMKARDIQNRRFRRSKVHTNAGMSSRQIKKHCETDAESDTLLERAMDKFGLSARAHSRILKIARTIADLEGAPDIRAPHVAESIQYRTLDRRTLR